MSSARSPFTITSLPGYVLVVVHVPFTRELAIAAAVEATRARPNDRPDPFLYDLRESRNTVSVLGNYEFVHLDMPEMDIDPLANVALLVSPEDRSHDFIETLSRNEGYRVCVFRDERGAVEWLRVTP